MSTRAAGRRALLGLPLVVGFSGIGSPSAAAHALRTDWMAAWSVSPVEITPIIVVGVLYGVRARRLGSRLSFWHIASFYAGLAVLALALVSPIDSVGEGGLFSVHMLQHTLLGAIAPLLLLLGLTGAVLRPLLTVRWTRRLMVLTHPLAAFSAWVIDLAFWQIPPVYNAALDNNIIHATEHIALVTFGLLMWAPIVEVLPGPEGFTTRWKCLYMVGVWMVGLTFANILWFSGTVFYPHYLQTAPAFGVSALQDQGYSGAVMMATHCMLAFVVGAVLFYRYAGEELLRQRLIEAGLDALRVDRAIRAGRAKELARRYGLSVQTRGGID